MRERCRPFPNLALQPPQVLTTFGPDHVKTSRGVQGVPRGMERAANGHLWATWYAGKSPRVEIGRVRDN